jgi:hypothetical protein
MLGTYGSIPAGLNIHFAVTATCIAMLRKTISDCNTRDVTPRNMSHATCNDNTIKTASAKVSRQPIEKFKSQYREPFSV